MIETLNSVSNMPLRQMRTILILFPFVPVFLHLICVCLSYVCSQWNQCGLAWYRSYKHNCCYSHRTTRLSIFSKHMWRKIYTNFIILFFLSCLKYITKFPSLTKLTQSSKTFHPNMLNFGNFHLWNQVGFKNYPN